MNSPNIDALLDALENWIDVKIEAAEEVAASKQNLDLATQLRLGMRRADVAWALRPVVVSP
jgi:hypothetical protein